MSSTIEGLIGRMFAPVFELLRDVPTSALGRMFGSF